MGDARGRDRAGARILFGLAIAAAAGSAVLAFSDGFSLRLYGIRVSSHGGLRPALFSLLFAVAAYRLHPRREELLAVWQRSILATTWLVPWIAPAAAAVMLALGFAYGVRAAGGSDVYGYVSQARLWLAGDLRVHQDFVKSVPWPNAEWTFTPLAYRPAAGQTIVPTYAPGLPLLMAMFMRLGGPCGAFIVNPICGAMLVLLAYVLGLRVSGRITGAIAALLVASSPTLLFMSFWPMSDVPSAAFWIGSLIVACQPASSMTAAIAGTAAGAAIAIRPNLLPLAVVPAALVGWQHGRRSLLAALRALAMFALCCAPFLALVAWFNQSLYGSIHESGYGDIGTIFRWSYLSDNLSRYPRWLWQTQGVTAFLFLLALVVPRGPSADSTRLRRVLFCYAMLVFACYVFYAPFDDWWYLRFLAPALPVMFVLAADVVWHGTARFGVQARIAATLLFLFIAVNHAITFGRTHAIFEIGEGEQKYADVGRYLAEHLPPGAIVLALQHSGSIRYYSGLLTLRYESLDGSWLDRAIDYLKASGRQPYIVLEGWEVPRFRAQFAGQQYTSTLDRAPLAAHSRVVYLYNVEADSAEPPQAIPHTTGCK